MWSALGEVLQRAFAGRRETRLATVLGCRDRTEHGSPLEVDGRIPGLRVTRAQPPGEVVLEGEHRFSRYALIFRIDPAGSGSASIRAETLATFPGLLGAAYRLAVIGTRGHVLVVRGLLRRVRERAEHTERRPGSGEAAGGVARL